MTSNIGADVITETSVGFSPTVTAKDKVMDKVKEYFRPEFLGRLSNIIYYDDLSKQDLEKIARKHLNEFIQNAIMASANQLNEITYDEKIPAILVEKGFIREKGGRSIRSYIEHVLGNELAIFSIENETRKLHIGVDDSDSNYYISI